MAADRLTDEELEWIARASADFAKEGRDYRPSPEFYDAPLRLVAEVRAARKALNGFRWLGNNLHNIRDDPARFEEFYRAALKDAGGQP